MLHGLVGAGFYGETGQLQYFNQAGNRIGARNTQRSMANFEARFGVWTGLEINLHTAYDTWDRVYWQDINFDGTAPAGGQQQTERRKGLTDVTVGAKYAILSEARGTGDVTSWTIETQVKIPGAFSIYPTTVNSTNLTNPSPESAAGTPGTDVLFKTSFSRRVRFADPYVEFFYQSNGSWSDPSEGIGTIHPADNWGTFFGTELVGFEQRADNLKFSADIGVGWKWIDGGEVPVNRFTYGPSRTSGDPTVAGNVVNEQGHIEYDGRVGFFYQLQQHARATGHVTVALPGDHFMESYPGGFTDTRSYAQIRNQDTYVIGYEFGMQFLF